MTSKRLADILFVAFQVIPTPLRKALFIFRVRSVTGNTPIPKERAMRQMLRSLKRNEILGILIERMSLPTPSASRKSSGRR